MSTLPLEVHEVLEDEYRSMYDAEPESVDFGEFEILDDQEDWARSILSACGVKQGDLTTSEAIKNVLAQFVDGKRRVEDLEDSPAVSETGRTIIKTYEAYADDEDKRKLNRRIVDEAMCGSTKPLRDMRLAKLYAALHARENPEARTALCISGGGIRSATFALGVIQGLSSANILNKFHFLSTVSGGGYIGSWLSSWIRRHPEGAAGVQDDLARADTASGGAAKKALPQSMIDPEPPTIRHLREYSNYLSPKLGLTSADTWTLAALYLRNLMLNLLVLVPIIAAALAIPRFFSLLLRWSAVQHFTPSSLLNVMLGFLILGFGYLGLARPAKQGRKAESFHFDPNSRFIIGCIAPLAGAATMLALFWAKQTTTPVDLKTYKWYAIAAVLATTAFPCAIYYLLRYIPASAAERRAGLSRQGAFFILKKLFVELIGTTVGVLTSGAILVLIAVKLFPDPLRQVPDVSRIQPFLRPLFDSVPQAQLYVCFAVPLVLVMFFVQASVFVGFSGFFNEDDDREWWGRAGAFLLLFACGMGAVSAIAVLGPVFLYRAPVILSSIGGLSGIAAAAFGFSARTPANNKQKEQTAKPSSAMSTLSSLAVPLFVVVALAGIALGTTWLLEQFNGIEINEGRVAFAGQFESQATFTEEVPYQGRTFDVKREAPKMAVTSLPVARGIAHLQTIERTSLTEALAIIGVALGAFLLSFFIGANKFSMHALYRNRLIRAYLGASRYRRDPDRFTGFDENDNLQMFQLRNELVWSSSFGDGKTFAKELLAAVTNASSSEKMAVAEEVWHRLGRVTKKLKRGDEVDSALRDQLILGINAVLLDVDLATLAPEAARKAKSKSLMGRNREIFASFFTIGTPQPRGPFHVVNTALNLVAGDNLAWQQRKAASFTVSPLHSGSLYAGYRNSREYGGPEGISIGTAVTISGAAASPNQGYHSSPALAFLMTLLNIRLGWWLGNPGVAGRRAYRRAHPWSNVRLLFKESTGQTNDKYAWVYLSDGGHFENLGLYEMVLRRTRYIVVSDGGCDPKYTFEDLGNAIRKIRTDLGVPIDIRDLSMQPRQEPNKLAHGRYIAIGTIRYSAIDGNDPKKDGVLVYLKPGLYDDSYFPRDVYNYAQESLDFPHESTADQFFSESQFESYRALGRHVINEICGNYPAPKENEPWFPAATTYDTVAHFTDVVRGRTRAMVEEPPEWVIANSVDQPPATGRQLKIRVSTPPPA